MPETEVILYREDDGSVPLPEWLASIPAEARDRCIERLVLLARHGHELRRPHDEHLKGTDLYELRVKFFRVNYRMLSFFHERIAAMVSPKNGRSRPARSSWRRPGCRDSWRTPRTTRPQPGRFDRDGQGDVFPIGAGPL